MTLTKIFPSVLRLRVCPPPRCATKGRGCVSRRVVRRFTRKERTFCEGSRVVGIIQNKLKEGEVTVRARAPATRVSLNENNFATSAQHKGVCVPSSSSSPPPPPRECNAAHMYTHGHRGACARARVHTAYTRIHTLHTRAVRPAARATEGVLT